MFSRNRNIPQNHYNNARANLLLVLVFTVINIVLAATGSATYFLFSATVPYVISLVGYDLAFNPEYGMGMIALVVSIVIAAILLLPYLLCWIFSKKSKGWLIGALVWFALDTVLFLIDYLPLFEPSMLFDILFHAWVLYELVRGVMEGNKSNVIPDNFVPTDFVENTTTQQPSTEDQTPNT